MIVGLVNYLGCGFQTEDTQLGMLIAYLQNGLRVQQQQQVYFTEKETPPKKTVLDHSHTPWNTFTFTAIESFTKPSTGPYSVFTTGPAEPTVTHSSEDVNIASKSNAAITIFFLFLFFVKVFSKVFSSSLDRRNACSSRGCGHRGVCGSAGGRARSPACQRLCWRRSSVYCSARRSRKRSKAFLSLTPLQPLTCHRAATTAATAKGSHKRSCCCCCCRELLAAALVDRGGWCKRDEVASRKSMVVQWRQHSSFIYYRRVNYEGGKHDHHHY